MEFLQAFLCASGIQLDVGANRLFGAPSGRRNDSTLWRYLGLSSEYDNRGDGLMRSVGYAPAVVK